MMTRRFVMAGLLALPAGQVVADQGRDDFKWAFDRLSAFERRNLQVELQMAGLYAASVDGSYGPSTRRAIVSAPNFLRDNSQGRVRVELVTLGDLETFLRDIATGEYSKWLYGEGDEGM